VIKEVSNTSFPLLTKGNYEEWSLKPLLSCLSPVLSRTEVILG
jgi:hypothetical protein